MISKDEALQLIKDSIESLYRSGTLTQHEKITPETILLGSGSFFDSVDFITFITDVEDRIQQKTDKEYYLVLNDIQKFNVDNPYLTVEILAQYISKLVDD